MDALLAYGLRACSHARILTGDSFIRREDTRGCLREWRRWREEERQRKTEGYTKERRKCREPMFIHKRFARHLHASLPWSSSSFLPLCFLHPLLLLLFFVFFFCPKLLHSTTDVDVHKREQNVPKPPLSINLSFLSHSHPPTLFLT